MRKRILTAVLILVIAFTSTFPSFAESRGKILCIGDSMTYNIAARHNWLYNIENFGYYVAKELDYDYIASNLQLPGGRSTDILACLSRYHYDNDGNKVYEYNGDDYSAGKLLLRFDDKTVGEIRESYEQDVKNASIVTLNSGYSNTTVFYLQYLKSVFINNNPEWDLDLSDLLYDEEKAKLCNTLRRNIRKTIGYNKLEQNEKVSNNILKKIDMAVYGLTYMFMSEMISFDKLVERIKELNPEAQIYVLEMFNPVEYANLSLEIPCGCGKSTIILPLGKMLGGVFDQFNKYHSKYSKQRKNYCYVKKSTRHTFSLSATDSLQGSTEMLNCIIRDIVRDGALNLETDAQRIVFELWFNGKDVSKLVEESSEKIKAKLLKDIMGNDNDDLTNVNDVRNFVKFYLKDQSKIASGAANLIKADYRNCKKLIEKLTNPSNPIHMLNNPDYINKISLGLQKILAERTISINSAVKSLISDGYEGYVDAINNNTSDLSALFSDGTQDRSKGLFYILEQVSTEEGYKKISFADRSAAHIVAIAAANATSIHPDSQCNIDIANDLIAAINNCK